MNNEKLNKIRTEIDTLDEQLIDILYKRNALISEIAISKQKTGKSVYAPERETELLRNLKNKAKDKGVSGDLVDNLMRRIINSSYESQSSSKLAGIGPLHKDIVIIGGGGKLGKLFVRLFLNSGYTVKIIEKNDWENAAKTLSNASLALVSVPINSVEEVLEQIPLLPKECVLADITSVKEKPVKKMQEIHKGPVIGLHPMFGPDVKSLVKQVIIYCPARHMGKCDWILTQFKMWGASAFEMEPAAHDRIMGYVQAVRHFTTFVLGFNLMRENINLEEIIQVCSPIYRLELIMVGRLFAQDPELYADIIFSSKKNLKLLRSLINRFNEALNWVENGDKKEFVRSFKDVYKWFGKHSENFLKESGDLLEEVYIQKQKKY
ncbi:MAG: bifunctional chorismate mutase/prephenate dehydrogenase [Deltaproteobacteria bacterium]|nr:bifunctional chorismate mutase/prephenate dehydrogenase [Deltaproteobacteria bacterium]